MKTIVAVWGCLAVATSALSQPVAVPSQDQLVMQGRLAMVVRQSSNLYDAGQYEAALDRLGSLSGEEAQDPSVLNLRGAILTRLGQFDEAQRIFELVLDAEPNSLPAAFNLGELQIIQGDYREALSMFQSLLNRDPRNELLRLKVIACELLTGNEAGAQREASALIPAGQTPAWYYAQALLAQKQGRDGEVKKFLNSAHAIYGKDVCKLFDESITPFNL
jgi:Flp pilus assembly protein TadD